MSNEFKNLLPDGPVAIEATEDDKAILAAMAESHAALVALAKSLNMDRVRLANVMITGFGRCLSVLTKDFPAEAHRAFGGGLTLAYTECLRELNDKSYQPTVISDIEFEQMKVRH
jgi:hypothetical protein